MPRRISECTAVVLNAFVWLVMLCWILTIAEFYGACPKVTDMWSLSQADDPSLGSSGTNVRGRKCIEWNKNKGVEYTLLGLHLLLDLLGMLSIFLRYMCIRHLTHSKNSLPVPLSHSPLGHASSKGQVWSCFHAFYWFHKYCECPGIFSYYGVRCAVWFVA